MIPVVVGNLIPIVTLSVFSRVLTPHDYGVWALAVAYGVFTTGLANFGLGVIYERNFFQFKEGDQPAGLLYSVLVFVAGAYLICICGTWLLRNRISLFLVGDLEAARLVFWATCATGFAGLKRYYMTYLRNTTQAKTYVWFSIDETLLTTVFSLLFVVYFRTGVIGLAWSQLSAAALVFTLVTARFVRTLRPSFSWPLLLHSLKLGLPLTPKVFVGAAAKNLDKYLIALLASVDSAGVYSIGQKLSYMVFGFMSALENVFAPQVYERMFGLGPAGGKSIGRYLTPFVYVSVAMAVAVSLFSEEALIVLTPKAYHGAIPVVNLFTIYYAIMFFGKQNQLVYAKKTYLLGVLTIVNLASNAVFNVIFIKHFGLVGGAVGTLMGGIVSVVVYNLVAMRFYRIEWEARRLAGIYGTLLAAAAVTMLLRNAGVDYVWRLGAKLVICGAYAGLGVYLSILTRENLTIARSVIGRRLGRRPASEGRA
jgi:O-antigen/teichoic acid export membrane protein